MKTQTIRLEKISEAGKNVFWEAVIHDNEVEYSWGAVNGKIQREIKTYLEGKNIGKSNETSPSEQCLFEAEKKARLKIEKGYILIKGNITTTSKTAIASDLSVPKPILAKPVVDKSKMTVTVIPEGVKSMDRLYKALQREKALAKKEKEMLAKAEERAKAAAEKVAEMKKKAEERVKKAAETEIAKNTKIAAIVKTLEEKLAKQEEMVKQTKAALEAAKKTQAEITKMKAPVIEPPKTK
jgi:predicted DNA-binding WGR domain protein